MPNHLRRSASLNLGRLAARLGSDVRSLVWLAASGAIGALLWIRTPRRPAPLRRWLR
jgi:hypothetical protein